MPPEYVSVFKIDGVPILGPVMTKDRRAEMRQLREIAIQVEERIKSRKINPVPIDTVHVPVTVPEKRPDPPELPEFDCDETATSEMLLTDIIDTGHPSTIPIEEPMVPVSPETSEEESPPTPDEPLRSPLDGFSSPKLIRSNSYTLDQPSPMLLQFLDKCKEASVKKASNRSSKSVSGTPSPGNRKNKTPRKLTDPSKLRSVYGVKCSPVRKQLKNESLDDTKRRLTIHSKGEKVEKFFMKSKSVKDFQNLTQQPAMTMTTNKINTHSPESSPERPTQSIPTPIDPLENKENVIDSLDHSHAPESTIIEKQEADNKSRLLDQSKQKQLLALHDQLSALNLVDRTSTPVQRHVMSSVEDTQSEQEDDKERFNETSFYSTIRGESPICSMSLVSDAYSKQYLHSIRSFTESPTLMTTTSHQYVSVRQQENEEIAATIINSHVRGYLIRRLLRTEFVQSIIENIKNILFMILDANPRDIQLKRTYLMQLNGNCEKLHDVFFKYSTKERMQVINGDREMLLQRLKQQRAKRPSSSGGGIKLMAVQ